MAERHAILLEWIQGKIIPGVNLECVQNTGTTIEPIHNTVRCQNYPVVKMIFGWHFPYLSRDWVG